MICTFYSYKGGVGRSMALANVGYCLAQSGLRVVVVDWDLESPGLAAFYFHTEEGLRLLSLQLGVIDLLGSYQRRYRSLLAPNKSTIGDGALLGELEPVLPPLADVLYPVPLSQAAGSGGGGLWLIPGGMSHDRSAYYRRVSGLDWDAFYRDFRGQVFFEWMRRQFADIADVVLIDSRSGMTDMGGVCTRQLADVVVAFCAPNQQSLEGTAAMVESFKRAELVAMRRGRPVQAVIVPAFLDGAASSAGDRFREAFNAAFAAYTPAALSSRGGSFWDFALPYVPRYAYGETLLDFSDSQSDDTLACAYRRLASALLLLGEAGPHRAAGER